MRTPPAGAIGAWPGRAPGFRTSVRLAVWNVSAPCRKALTSAKSFLQCRKDFGTADPWPPAASRAHCHSRTGNEIAL
jgi:hypothetical protein